MRKLIAVILAVCCAAGLAEAADKAVPRSARTPPDVFKPDPMNTWRKFSDKQLDSRCVGKLTTPACAIETLIEGARRGDAGLVSKAFPDLTPTSERDALLGVEDIDGQAVIYLRYAEIERIWPTRERHGKPKIGDSLLILIELQTLNHYDRPRLYAVATEWRGREWVVTDFSDGDRLR